MNTTNKSPTSLLIAGITPYFLERDALWFREHHADIQKKSLSDEWWRNHTAFIASSTIVPFSPFLRKLTDMGYTKVSEIAERGEFATRGGIIDVYPINCAHPLRMEFSGNVVERIIPLDTQSAEKIKIPKLEHPSDYERLWLADLKPNDYVVHIDHGIGIFRGITTAHDRKNPPRKVLASDNHQEFYLVEYAPPRHGGMPDRLLVPRALAKKLSRYVGFETPAIHRLGGNVWLTTKRKAKEDVIKFAHELMDLFRARARALRSPYPQGDEVAHELASSFPFSETEDQKRALADIERDLSAPRPMDRLLLGDVGFGKTEIAIRAAARVAYAGAQVALLVPTTILADQHLSTFRDRLSSLPLTIALLTRLTSTRDITQIIRDITAGKIDIVIGTHRLLSKDIVWRSLGLVIIDEEQRFGVRQKERFKHLRAHADFLSLSATPIPRTLSLTLAKFRDLSMIQTPPSGRIPIKTFVLPFSKKIVAEAIARERQRNGQIFYLWNRIENIEAMRQAIQELTPQSSIRIIHGRMHERELVRTMHEFKNGAVDILLATTIIENGLDLPSVNTLIVANAARLGLAQAYQLRGRIGRANTPAYAYFLYPPRSLSNKGKMRLTALKEIEGLGGGFRIALRDLEIRGAGNVFGKQQSGTMHKVGLNLYAQLLEEAVEELRGDETPLVKRKNHEVC